MLGADVTTKAMVSLIFDKEESVVEVAGFNLFDESVESGGNTSRKAAVSEIGGYEFAPATFPENGVEML
jgi:hypothetical protein